MPKLISKVEGRGNGIKTAIPNMADLGKALNRPPGHITKFFGIEMGALSRWDDKTSTSIVNGAHSAEDLSEVLQKFIRMFVLCTGGCGNPETVLEVKKGKYLIKNCLACGTFSEVDMMHNLSTQILKESTSKKKGGKTKAEKRAAKIAKAQGKTVVEDEDEDEAAGTTGDNMYTKEKDPGLAVLGDLDNVANVEETSISSWSLDMSEEAVKARRAEFEATLSTQALSSLAIDEDEDAAAKKQAEADAAAKAKEEEAAAAAAAAAAEEEEEDDGEVDMAALATDWRDFVIAQGAEPKWQDVNDKFEQVATKVSDSPGREQMLFFGLFDENIRTENQLSKFKDVLLRQITARGAATQLTLLACLEKHIEQHKKLADDVPHLLMGLYEDDVVEEDTILTWFAGDKDKGVVRIAKKKYAKLAREKAEPFIKWLQEAEEDSDEDE